MMATYVQKGENINYKNDGSEKIAYGDVAVSYTHLRAHETRHDLVCRLLLEKKKKKKPI